MILSSYALAGFNRARFMHRLQAIHGGGC